jgi:hypothetical protein
MLPGMGALLGLGAGAPTAGGGIPGFSGSSSATSGATGAPVSFGGFTFQPKGGGFPPAAWIAIAIAGAALIAWGRRR